MLPAGQRYHGLLGKTLRTAVSRRTGMSWSGTTKSKLRMPLDQGDMCVHACSTIFFALDGVELETEAGILLAQKGTASGTTFAVVGEYIEQG